MAIDRARTGITQFFNQKAKQIFLSDDPCNKDRDKRPDLLDG
jgi:hypothetical protein